MSNSAVLRFNDKSSNLVFHKTLLHVILLFIIVTVTYRVFLVSIAYFLVLVTEVLFEAFILLYLASRVMKRILEKNASLNHLEIYLLILWALPILPAIGAYQRFGQPLHYGLLTFRDFYLIFGGLIIYNMLRAKQITIEMVEKAFVWLCVFNMFFSYFLSMFVDARQFQDTGIAGANDMKGGEVYFRFNMSMFFFGSIYFTVKAFYKKNYAYLIYTALFLVYIIFFRLDRTSIAAAVSGIGLFALTGLTVRNQFLSIFRFVLPGIMALLISSVAFPEVIERYTLMFRDAAATASGSRNDYAEESVRLMELKIAIAGIKDKPFIGNGKVSNNWKEGGYNAFYKFFYASDVGIFGQVYMYGFIGASILYGQFLFALFFALRIRHIKRDVFLVTLKCFLFAHSIDSITNGYITIYAGQTITAVILVYWYYQQDRIIAYQLKLDKYKTDKETVSQEPQPALT